MMMILTPSRWNSFLDCARLVKPRKLLPHTPLWERLYYEYLHLSINSKWKTSFKHMISSRWLILSHGFSSMMTITIKLLILQDMLAIGSTLSYDHSSDHTLSTTMVITWSSLLSSSFYHLIFFTFFSFLPWDQHMIFKHYLWTNPTSVTQCKH